MVQEFAEKPSREAIESGRWQTAGGDSAYEASMGIYLFKRTSLEALLTTGKAETAVNVGPVSPVPRAQNPVSWAMCPLPCAGNITALSLTVQASLLWP